MERLRKMKPSLNLNECKQDMKKKEKRSNSYHQQAFKHKQQE
jgi:hypothetical protein